MPRLTITIFATGVQLVEKLRRRPALASINKRPFEKAFGDKAIKLLGIPEIIDEYNRHKSEVDRFDQLRSYYSTQRAKQRTWRALLYFILDVVVNNCYRLSSYSLPNNAKRGGHKSFIYELIEQLLKHGGRLCQGSSKRQKLNDVVPNSESLHGKPVSLYTHAKPCVACAENGRKNNNRQPLGTISSNTLGGRQGPRRPPRTTYGCQLCGIPLCRPSVRPQCWVEHLQRAKTIQGVNTSMSSTIK